MNFLKQFFLGRLNAKQFTLRLIALFVLYVASIGPMYWTWYESIYLSGPKWVARLYSPLQLLCNVVPVLGRFVDWYIGLWID